MSASEPVTIEQIFAALDAASANYLRARGFTTLRLLAFSAPDEQTVDARVVEPFVSADGFT